MPRDSIEDLLRSTRMHYGHIQLFRDDQGWQASVYHYEPKRLTHDGRAMDDPVAALRAALIEDERRTKDLERRYAGSVKMGTVEQVQDTDGFCMICEGGGCDLCNTAGDDFGSMFD